MTQRLQTTYRNDEQEDGLNWARIAGFTLVIAFHAAAVLLLLAPVNPPSAASDDTEVTRVVIIEPPPPPPEQPPIIVDTPSPMDTPAPPPAPPSPPAATPDIAGGDVDASTRSQFPIAYPPAAARSGVTGVVIVQVTFDAQGRITDAKVFKSSRNRDLDRAAVQGVRRWTVKPAMRNGQPVGGVANVTVDFNLN